MSDATRQLQATRAVEDRAAKLGAKRRECESTLNRNTHKIIDLLRDSRSSGVPLRRLAALLGVSRQTLYRWLEVAAQIPEGRSAGQWAAERASEGAEHKALSARNGELGEPRKEKAVLDPQARRS